jgi:hypothetical protein
VPLRFHQAGATRVFLAGESNAGPDVAWYRVVTDHCNCCCNDIVLAATGLAFNVIVQGDSTIAETVRVAV